MASTTRMIETAASSTVESKTLSDQLERSLSLGHIESKLADGEIVGIDDTGNKLGVGDRRLACRRGRSMRPRIGPGADRPDIKRAGCIEPGDRTAACTDFDNVYDRRAHRIAEVRACPFELVFGSDSGLAVRGA